MAAVTKTLWESCPKLPYLTQHSIFSTVFSNFKKPSNIVHCTKMDIFQEIYLIQMNKQQLSANFFIFVKKHFKGKPQFFYQDSIFYPYSENFYKRNCPEVF